MPRFDTPPNWWVTLANLTDWFHWDAIAAVGTTGAALWAIHTWRDSQKSSRRREAAAIAAVVQPIAVSAKLLDQMFLNITNGRPAEASVSIIIAPGALRSQASALEAIRAIELPSVVAIDVVSASTTAILGAVDFAEQYALATGDAQRMAILNGLREIKRSLFAYAWILEREARLIGGATAPPPVGGVDDIEALHAREEAKKIRRMFWRR